MDKSYGNSISRIATLNTKVLGHVEQKRKNAQANKEIAEIDEWTETLKSHTANKTQDFSHAMIKLNNNMHTEQKCKIRFRQIIE